MRHHQLPRIGGLIAMVSLVLAAPTSVQQENSLQQRVSALEAQTASLAQQLGALTQPAVTVNVRCADGETIQAALAKFHSHPAPLRINLFGVCAETLRVTRQVLIRAGAPGAGITAANPSLFVIHIFANPGMGIGFLGLEGLTISGGNIGVNVDAGQVRLTDCAVRNNGLGVRVTNGGIAGLENTVVENNNGGGVSASTGAQIFMTGGAIQNNGQSNAGGGLDLNDGATADVGGSAQIASNGGFGVSLGTGSVLKLNAAVVTGNGITGIFVTEGSTIALGTGATITANTQSGISLMDTSLLTKRRGEADIHITNNGRYGVVCSDPPAVAQIVGFAFETGDISGNPLGNINCPISPGPKSQ